jgi:hypothetical protein
MKKIRVALIYKSSYVFLSGNHFDNTTYYFFMHALKRNPNLEVSYFPSGESFDTDKLAGKFDIILLPNNNIDGTPNELINIKKSDIPIICRIGDPHWAKRYNQFQFHEKWKIDCYFNFMHQDYFYKFYPKNYNYKTIVFGLEPSLYQNLIPYRERIGNRVLNSGAVGKSAILSRFANRILNPNRSSWYFYKLRTMCNDLSYVVHTRMLEQKYVNDDYPRLLSNYKSAIAATTFYPTIKYLEIPAAGCTTFMEITAKNNGQYLGFKDYETAVFINEKNYKEKFKEFLHDQDNPKWERIAENGRRHVIENLTNDKAAESLVGLMESYLK